MAYSDDELRACFNGCRVLITGASSGIGAEFANQLAQLGCSLVLTARRKDRLDQLAQELSVNHGIDVHVESMDLAADNAPATLKTRLDEHGLAIDILINNAGFGFQADFIDRDWRDWESVIDLDIRAFTQVSHVFARDMVERGIKGRILQLGSIFSFGGVPSFAVYSGAKSYVLAFSEALAEELKPHGIQVTTLAPGVTRTEFLDVANGGKISETARRLMQSPQQVVAEGLEAMAAARPLVVSGWINKLLVFSRRYRSRSGVAQSLGRASKV